MGNIEYKFSTFCYSNDDSLNDLVVVKEQIHADDGSVRPNLRFIHNYQRPYWTTKPEFRDHEQKKEYEVMAKLDKHYSTESQLGKSIHQTLEGKPLYGYCNLRKINDSPYVYGSNVSSTSLIEMGYRKKNPDAHGLTSLAVMDYETDVVNGTNKIISGSVSCKEQAHISVVRGFLGDEFSDEEWINQIKAMADKYLGNYISKRKIDLNVTIVDREDRVVTNLINTTHQLQPDILGYWNMPFDMGKMLEALEGAEVDPANVFSDPKVPVQFKFFNWNEAQPIKTTSAGKQTIKHIADLWHTAKFPASFYCIDLMCLYKRLRVGKQNKNSYALDAILNDELGIRKLKFTEADHLSGYEWHQFMQKHYKIEYIIYNLFDCISVELLDEKTKDVQSALLNTLGISDIKDFSSNPKRLTDDLYLPILERDRVMGVCGTTLWSSMDELTPELTGFIITLPSELVIDMGLPIINEHPTLKTNIVAYGFDIDIQSAYPTGEFVLNISVSTRLVECYQLTGLSDQQMKSFGINLTGIQSNAVKLAQLGFNFTELDTLYDQYMSQ